MCRCKYLYVGEPVHYKGFGFEVSGLGRSAAAVVGPRPETEGLDLGFMAQDLTFRFQHVPARV